MATQIQQILNKQLKKYANRNTLNLRNIGSKLSNLRLFFISIAMSTIQDQLILLLRRPIKSILSQKMES